MSRIQKGRKKAGYLDQHQVLKVYLPRSAKVESH